jgi:hypothetical protein
MLREGKLPRLPRLPKLPDDDGYAPDGVKLAPVTGLSATPRALVNADPKDWITLDVLDFWETRTAKMATPMIPVKIVTTASTELCTVLR